jgi:hypothetical protein
MSGLPFLDLSVAALTAVPTGSMPSEGIPSSAASEVDKMLLNKKLALIYMTHGEEEAIKFANAHSRSGWIWKLEIAKLRNLVPGSIGYYMGSARVSMYGEASFLASLENCPLMWGEAHKQADNKLFMEWQRIGFVANRDYKNYNICHKHERMQRFYRAAAQAARDGGQVEMADEFEYLAKCLDDVGVQINDGTYAKWEYGLQTGWAHTMLFHCVHNTCAARAVEGIISEATGWKRYIGRHQGDDSAEVWSEPLAGPFAQAILDAAGQVGQATKQHFARDVDSWSEFLRVWYGRGMQRGSSLRSICSFVSADSQHSTYEGGTGMVKSIVDGCNTLWRRAGGHLGWRRSDVSVLLEYWSTSNEKFRNGKTTQWELHMAAGQDGYILCAYPDLRWKVQMRKVENRQRYPLEVGPILLRRARRNLHQAARAQEAYVYAEEYAKDVIECSVVRSGDVTGKVIGKADQLPDPSPSEQMVAEFAIKNCQKGRGGWRNEDAFSKEVVVGHYFAGSERVARAYLRDGRVPVGHCRPRMREILARGISLLAGKTRELVPLGAKYYCCAEKYWSHVELFLQRATNTHGCDPSVVGLAIARLAIETGEWL